MCLSRLRFLALLLRQVVLLATLAAAPAQVGWSVLSTNAPGWGSIAYHEALRQVVVTQSPFPGNFRTWLWDGTQWTSMRALPQQTPSWREGEALCYWSSRRSVVLFGGRSNVGTELDDLWEWDGARWRPVAASGSQPAPRYGAHLFHDAGTDRVVLFAGQWTNNQVPWNYSPVMGYADLWEFDGTAWGQVPATGVAPPQWAGPSQTWIYAESAWDASRQSLVVCHGTWLSPSPSYQHVAHDIWEWSRAGGWTKPVTGTPFTSARIAYDALRRRSVVRAYVYSSPHHATFEWDGNVLLQRSAAVSAPSTGDMIFDSSRGLLVGLGWYQSTLLGYGTSAPARVEHLGGGCGAWILSPKDGALPWTGQTFTTAVPLPSPVPGPIVALFGMRRQGTPWSFPLDLGFAGMPGCRLQFVPERTLAVTPSGEVALALPASASLFGEAFYEQVVAGFGTAPPWGWSTALAMTIGGR